MADPQFTDIHALARGGAADALTHALEHSDGADIHGTNRDSHTPLHLACLSGHVACANVLLDHGADTGAATTTGWTPLHLACFGGHGACCGLLLDRKANVNSTAHSGATPLHIACYVGDETCVRLLLDSGADVFATNNRGRTPSDIVGHGACDRSAVENIRDMLCAAMASRRLTFCQSEHFAVINFLTWSK